MKNGKWCLRFCRRQVQRAEVVLPSSVKLPRSCCLAQRFEMEITQPFRIHGVESSSKNLVKLPSAKLRVFNTEPWNFNNWVTFEKLLSKFCFGLEKSWEMKNIAMKTRNHYEESKINCGEVFDFFIIDQIHELFVFSSPSLRGFSVFPTPFFCRFSVTSRLMIWHYLHKTGLELILPGQTLFSTFQVFAIEVDLARWLWTSFPFNILI